jgi:hypothetical protein
MATPLFRLIDPNSVGRINCRFKNGGVKRKIATPFNSGINGKSATLFAAVF